jgi:hypothetical protein
MEKKAWHYSNFVNLKSSMNLNDRSFEDRDRTLKKIKAFFFKTLFLLTTDFVSPLMIIYHDFLVLFSSSS